MEVQLHAFLTSALDEVVSFTLPPYSPGNGGSMDLRNFGNPPQYYTASRPRRPRLKQLSWREREHGPPKRWQPTTTLHGVTTQKTSTCNLRSFTVRCYALQQTKRLGELLFCISRFSSFRKAEGTIKEFSNQIIIKKHFQNFSIFIMNHSQIIYYIQLILS